MRRPGDEDGVTTVEFALVLPFFLLLISIGTYFAYFAFVNSQLERAAGQAARFAAVENVNNPDGTPDYYSYCLDGVVDQINSTLVTGTVTATEITLSDGYGNINNVPGSSSSDPNKSGNTCKGLSSTSSASALPIPPTGFVKVTITHDFANPFTAFLTPFGVSGDFTLSATGQAEVETR